MKPRPPATNSALASALVALVAAANTAHADPEIAAIVTEPGPVAQRALVGGSGELFLPDGVGTYRRQGRGGVSVDVELAATAGGRLYAAGRRSPLFTLEGGKWRQHRVGQNGPVRPSTGGGVPAVAIRRQVFVLEGGTWGRAGAARVSPRAVWAGGRSLVYVADDSGGLFRLQGQRWTPVRTGLAPGDRIARIAGPGGAGRAVIAVSEAGAVLEIGAGPAARPIPLPVELAGFAVEAVCSQRDGTALLVGDLDDASTDNRSAVVLAIKRREVREVHRAPLASGDRPVACATDAAGGILWVTRGGDAWLGGPGETWTERRVALGPAAPTAPPVDPDKRPARTR